MSCRVRASSPGALADGNVGSSSDPRSEANQSTKKEIAHSLPDPTKQPDARALLGRHGGGAVGGAARCGDGQPPQLLEGLRQRHAKLGHRGRGLRLRRAEGGVSTRCNRLYELG